jgi:UDP-N-acetylmuramate dehydrogenase
VSGAEAELDRALVTLLGAGRIRRRAPLAPFTTFRVGGVADCLVEPRTAEEIGGVLAAARAAGVPVTILGGGSNVLIADRGIRGLVMRPRGGEIRTIDATTVRADAPVTVNGLVRWMIMHETAGLEAWAGTPGTVGGAVYGNAHFGGVSIGDRISSVMIVDRSGTIRSVPAGEMAFRYDESRLQESGEVLLSADFIVSPGNRTTLRETARQSLAFRKRTQPLDAPSAGCVFRNPQRGVDEVPDNLPWSAGALIDEAGLKGTVIGGARVSSAHGNFIVNDGTATAHDIRRLIARCQTAVRERVGVTLREEIVYLGEFDVITAD